MHSTLLEVVLQNSRTGSLRLHRVGIPNATARFAARSLDHVRAKLIMADQPRRAGRLSIGQVRRNTRDLHHAGYFAERRSAAVATAMSRIGNAGAASWPTPLQGPRRRRSGDGRDRRRGRLARPSGRRFRPAAPPRFARACRTDTARRAGGRDAGEAAGEFG